MENTSNMRMQDWINLLVTACFDVLGPQRFWARSVGMEAGWNHKRCSLHSTDVLPCTSTVCSHLGVFSCWQNDITIFGFEKCFSDKPHSSYFQMSSFRKKSDHLGYLQMQSFLSASGCVSVCSCECGLLRSSTGAGCLLDNTLEVKINVCQTKWNVRLQPIHDRWGSG